MIPKFQGAGVRANLKKQRRLRAKIHLKREVGMERAVV